MLKKFLFLLISTASILGMTNASASPYGINFSYLLDSKDPPALHGYRASFQYYPASWVWGLAHVFIDTGFGHWWVPENNPYRIINIYTIAPVLRLSFRDGFFTPFVDLSIGPSYLSKTHIDHQKLGIHFAFQDQIGIGTALGRAKKLAVSFSAVHYSNGSLSAHNSGITVPLMLNVSYRF